MTTREAQTIASSRLNKYCRGHCGALTLAHTQKIKNRWLVDFEAPREKFTVIVENDGNSKVTAWTKVEASLATSPRSTAKVDFATATARRHQIRGAARREAIGKIRSQRG